MARTDYGAILSTKIADTSQAIRDVNGTTGLIAPADWGTLIRAMRSAEDYENALSGLEQKTVSGSVASFTDGIKGVPVKSLIVDIDPVQSGTGDPSPDNIRPITGRTSATVTHTKGDSIVTKDIYPIEPTQDGTGDSSPTNVRPIHAGLTITRDDESILEVYEGSLNLTTGALEVTHTIVDLGTLDWFNQGSYFYPVPNLDAKSGSTNWLSSCIKKKPWETSWINMSPWEGGFGGYQFRVKDDGTSQTASEFKTRVQGFMLVYELDTPQTIQLSATELERAKAALEISTYTKTFPLCYGGKLNLTTGALKVDWVSADLSQLSFTKTASGLFATTSLRNSIKLADSGYSASRYIKSSHFNVIDSSSITGPQGTTPSPNGVMAENVTGTLYFNYTDVTTIEEFKTAMQGVNFIYELAEPYVAVLTKEEIKTLLGGNTFYADTGDVEVVYYANANL